MRRTLTQQHFVHAGAKCLHSYDITQEGQKTCERAFEYQYATVLDCNVNAASYNE